MPNINIEIRKNKTKILIISKNAIVAKLTFKNIHKKFICELLQVSFQSYFS